MYINISGLCLHGKKKKHLKKIYPSLRRSIAIFVLRFPPTNKGSFMWVVVLVSWNNDKIITKFLINEKKIQLEKYIRN